MFPTISFFILTYLLGSIPTSYWVGKYLFNIDIREHGSGNAGATNSMRVMGAQVAIPVLIVDVAKAFAATKLALFIPDISAGQVLHFKVVFGLVAVIGHIFPVFAQFKGGKGIASLTGVIFGISPIAAVFCLAVFIVVVTLSKMVSLGSIITSIALPFIYLFALNKDDVFLIGFSFAVILIVLVTHFDNIKRILAGEENTLNFKEKNDSYDETKGK